MQRISPRLNSMRYSSHSGHLNSIIPTEGVSRPCFILMNAVSDTGSELIMQIKWPSIHDFFLGDYGVEFQKYQDSSSYELEKEFAEARGTAEMFKQMGPILTMFTIIISMFQFFKFSELPMEWIFLLAGCVLLSWGQIRKCCVRCDAIQSIQRKRENQQSNH